MSGFGAAVGGGALNLLIENLSGKYGTTDTYNEQKRKDAESDYLAMERQGIMARTEGAKAAGLHPLAALGFQAGPSPSMPVGGEIKPFHMQTPERDANDPNDAFRNAQIRLMHAQADEAESRAAASLRAVGSQPGNAPPYPTEPENRVPGQSNVLSGIKVVPNEIQASANGTTIGTHPGGTDVKIPGGVTIRMPSKQLSESAEDLELLKYYAIAAMNKDRLTNYIKDDVPWALRGYWDDVKKALRIGDGSHAKGLFKRSAKGSQPSRKGGATGSW